MGRNAVQNQPDYLAGKLVAFDPNGPAQLLVDGQWCGHGEPVFRIFDVRDRLLSQFCIYCPGAQSGDDLFPNAVKLASPDRGDEFLVYDPRRHPANLFAWDKYASIEPRFAEPLVCEQCHGKLFRVAVGFEIPSDSESPNDTSWFALAAVCVGCGAEGIVFDDETA
jgi:hypothetical protein